MTPTQRLRFVEKKVVATGDNGCQYYKKIIVLQQWHTYEINYPTEKGEWKDVTLEKEQ